MDVHEAPYADTIKDTHADKIVQAYQRGEPDAAAMARNLLESRRVDHAPALQHAEKELHRHT